MSEYDLWDTFYDSKKSSELLSILKLSASILQFIKKELRFFNTKRL